MRGPTHALAGATTAGLFVAFAIPHGYPVILLSGVAALAALVPDLDGSESTLENLEVFGLRPFEIPAFFVNIFFKHRGYLHSLLALALIAFLLLGFLPNLPREFVIAILLGYFSHLVTDGLTPQGIPWFYPYENHFSLLPRFLTITTGSFTESLFFVCLIVLYIIFLDGAGYINLPR